MTEHPRSPNPMDSSPRTASDDPVANIQFAGATCTINRPIPSRVRLCAAAVVVVALSLTAFALAFANWWLQLFALPAVVGGAWAGVLVLWPDTRIIFDAQAKCIAIVRRCPWADIQCTREILFSTAFSVGVTKRKDEKGLPDSYVAELRLNGGRNIMLWRLVSWPRADAHLIDLQRLTGLPREDRLG